MTRYIDTHKDEFGVEPICRVLQFAPQTYYAAKDREPSQRAIRDEWLKGEIQRVFDENRKAYGSHHLGPTKMRRGLQTSSTGSSAPARPTASGCVTSPTSRRIRAGSTSPL
jgi:hypothetical protein